MIDVLKIAEHGVDFFERSSQSHLLDHLLIFAEPFGA